MRTERRRFRACPVAPPSKTAVGWSQRPTTWQKSQVKSLRFRPQVSCLCVVSVQRWTRDMEIAPYAVPTFHLPEVSTINIVECARPTRFVTSSPHSVHWHASVNTAKLAAGPDRIRGCFRLSWKSNVVMTATGCNGRPISLESARLGARVSLLGSMTPIAIRSLPGRTQLARPSGTTAAGSPETPEIRTTESGQRCGIREARHECPGQNRRSARVRSRRLRGRRARAGQPGLPSPRRRTRRPRKSGERGRRQRKH